MRQRTRRCSVSSAAVPPVQARECLRAADGTADPLCWSEPCVLVWPTLLSLQVALALLAPISAPGPGSPRPNLHRDRDHPVPHWPGTPAFSPGIDWTTSSSELTRPDLRCTAVAAFVSAINYAALHSPTSSVQHSEPRGHMGGDDCSSRRSSRGACFWRFGSPRASAGRALWQQQKNKRDT